MRFTEQERRDLGVGPGFMTPAQSQTSKASVPHCLGVGENSSNYLVQHSHFQDGATDSERMKAFPTVS